MYAIIATDGRQYRVQEGQVLKLDFRDVPKGATLTFERVLAVGGDTEPRVGTPVVAGASVTAEVLGATLGEKIYVQKFRRRKTYRRRTGHRAIFTQVRIDKILSP